MTQQARQPLDSRTLVSSFLRCHLVGANFNTKGMQNIGLAYAMEPCLQAIYEGEALIAARKRYFRHYNTHPFWTPMLVGIFLSLERDIAAGRIPAQMFESVKKTTTYTLSAIGDSFFGGSFLAFWGLATTCLLAAGYHGLAVALGVTLFIALQLFKATTFTLATREGFHVLKRVKKLDLVNWGTRLKGLNGLLLLMLWTFIWPGEFIWWQWLGGIICLGSCALFVARFRVAREFIFALMLGIYLAWPWIMQKVEQYGGIAF